MSGRRSSFVTSSSSRWSIRTSTVWPTATATTSAAMVGSIDDVIGHIDAAVLAVPTRYHVELAVRLAEAGVHVLVEKPLAEDVTAAQQIVEACPASGVVLAVGHVERFNAAVAELPTFLDRADPRRGVADQPLLRTGSRRRDLRPDDP